MPSKWERFENPQEEPERSARENDDVEPLNRKVFMGSDGIEHVTEYKDGVFFVDGKEKKPFIQHKEGKLYIDGVEKKPFLEHRDGKFFVDGKEKHPFIEHREGKVFMQGKEMKPFSEIDAWRDMNLDKSPEELADGFLQEAERRYKRMGHNEDFYICKTKDGGLRLQLVKPIDPSIEWYVGKDPRSRQLLVEHYRKMKERRS